MLSIPQIVGETKQERDQLMTDQFNNLFADFHQNGSTLSRSARSQIPNGGSIYLNYPYSANLPTMEDDSEIAKKTVDGLLARTTNPDIHNVDTLADAIGVPSDSTEAQLSQYGIHVVNGQPYCEGPEDVSGFTDLVDVLGYEPAVEICRGQPDGPVLICSYQIRTEAQSRDSCGNEFPVINVTERILGINISIPEALRRAGVADPGLIIQRLYWLGGVQVPTRDIQNRLDAYQLHQEDRQAALLGESNGTIQVMEILNQNIMDQLPGGGANLAILFGNRKPKGLLLDPSPADMQQALAGIISRPADQTSDGFPGVVPPFVGLFRHVDLAKAFGLEGADLGEISAELTDQVADLCKQIVEAIRVSIGSCNVSMVDFQTQLGPSLDLLNFNIGMAKISFETYIPCLGVLTPTVTVPTGVTIDLPNLPVPPTPGELLDRLRAGVPEVARAAEQLLRSFEPLKVLRGQLPILAGVVGAVGAQMTRVVCVPRSLVDALEGGICGVSIPPEVIRECIQNNPTFELLLSRVRAYCAIALGFIERVQQLIAELRGRLDEAFQQVGTVADQQDGCLDQISRLVYDLVALSANTQAALGGGV